MHHRPRHEHCLLLARQTAFQNIPFKVNNNAVLIVICVKMRYFMPLIAFHIDVNFQDICSAATYSGMTVFAPVS